MKSREHPKYKTKYRVSDWGYAVLRSGVIIAEVVTDRNVDHAKKALDHHR